VAIRIVGIVCDLAVASFLFAAGGLTHAHLNQPKECNVGPSYESRLGNLETDVYTLKDRVTGLEMTREKK
jgi:hypothetical protein